MTRAQVQEWCEANDEELALFDGLDEALIGIGHRFEGSGHVAFVVYNRQKCLELLEKQGMSPEDAEEWMDFNVEGAYLGTTTPAFLTVPE